MANGSGLRPERRKIRILVTGGGTGGHVSPALAVVQTLHNWMAEDDDFPFNFVFHYVGSENGIEAKLVREANIMFFPIATGKLRRSSKGIRGLLSLANLRDAFRVPLGVGQAVALVQGFHPDVVLATGGYVSVPSVIAAGMSGVPVLIHEQTVTVGLANKIAGRFARRIALSFADSVDYLPPDMRKKAIVTGNPVRAALFGGDRNRAIERYGYDSESDLPCVYVTGGAQGSRIINRAIEEALPKLLAFCRIVHQCGKQPDGSEQDFDRLTAAKASLPDDKRRRYHATPFVEAGEIGDLFALADLIVGRSGAGTITEVCALGKPALFVPLQPASGDEQMKNAQRLVKAGAASILAQSECDGENLLRKVSELIADSRRLSEMGEAARKLSTSDASSDLATELLRLCEPTFMKPEKVAASGMG